MDLGAFTTYLFDFDGTLWDGARGMPGAGRLLSALQERGRQIVVISNNSQMTGADVERIVARSIGGVQVRALTVVDVAPSIVTAELGDGPVAVIGSRALVAACQAGGINVASPGTRGVAGVLLGCAPGFCYSDLEWITEQARRGKRLIATNADLFRPGPQGSRVPETGALLAAIQSIVRCEWTIIGKPTPLLFERAMALTGARPHACVVIGDGAETDIAGARRLGVRSVWIGHGAGNGADLAIRSVADLVLP